MGKFNKRNKNRSFRTRSKRRTFKTKKRKNNAVNIKRLAVLRVVIIVLIITVMAVGVAVPLTIYFLNSNSGTISSEDTAEEHFTDEQNEELLQIINRTNKLNKDYLPALEEVNSVKVNSLVTSDLKVMLEKANKDGVNILVDTAYISYEEQNSIYIEKYNSVKEENGYTAIKAESETVKLVPKAGESEAQTGLIITFSDNDEPDFSKSKSFSWLNENAVNYGFVLRYPKDKEEKTLLTYNPQVYRFVGKSNAIQMRILGMCLEEYKEYMEQK
ncbi:MAG: M15 family metallopeptidase [Ruminococcus sp.]|nr:M15 family metallopeptidase [Ruminococcus sp.]